MRKYIYFFLLVLFFFLSFQSRAQINYRLSLKPAISSNADSLFVDVYISRTSAAGFSLGNSNFVLNINTSALDTARSVGGMGIVTQGRWSNNTAQGGDGAQYLPMLLGRSPQAAFVNLQIRQLAGTTGTGISVPTDSALVARIFFKIKDCKANANITWRVNQQGIGAITTYNNTNIRSGATFVNPVAIPLRPAVFIPVLSSTATQSSVQFSWPSQPNAIRYEVNLNNSGTWQNITPSLDTAYNFTGLNGGQIVFLQVRAVVPCDTATSLTLTDTATAGCTVLPARPIGSNAQTCGTGKVTLKAKGTSGVTQYRWYTTETGGTPIPNTTDSIFVTPTLTATTIYYVAAVTNGCEGTERVADTAFVYPIPAAPLGISGNTGATCANSTEPYFITNPTAGATYQWRVENGTIVSASGSNVLVKWSNVTGAGTLSVKAISAKGCKGKDSLLTNVTINTSLALAFTAPDSVVTGQTFSAFVNTPDADTYTWLFGDGGLSGTGTTITHKYTQAGIYQIALVGSKSGGCVDTLRKSIKVKDVRIIYVPNAFSPKANGQQNRTLKVYGQDVSNNNFLFQLYSRWGDLIYQTSNFDEINQAGWSGGTQELGVYTYVLKGSFNNGEVFDKTGTVTLIK